MSLVIAAVDGDLDRVKAAVSGGEDIDGRGSGGDTALHKACGRGHVDIVKYLLDNGANAELKGLLNFTPLQVACFRGHAAVVHALLDHGVELNQTVTEYEIKFGYTPLQLACSIGNVPLVQALFGNGVDYKKLVTEDVIKDGKTPLQLACENGSADIVKLLFDHGVEFNETFNETSLKERGVTPLQLACKRGSAAVVKLLFDQEVELNETFKEASMKERGLTPLQLACENGSADIVKLLFDHGVELNETFNETSLKQRGVTPLQLACKRASADVVQILFDHGLEFQHIGYYRDALEKSMRSSNVHLTKILRKMKINPVTTEGLNEAYQQAQKRKSQNNRIPVLIIGQDRAGKTSLRNRLLGLPHNPQEPSTVGIRVDFIELSESSSKQPWKPKDHTRFLASESVAQAAVRKETVSILREKEGSFQTEEIEEQCQRANETEHEYSCSANVSQKKTETLSERTVCEYQPVIMKEMIPAKETDKKNTCPSEAVCKLDASEVAWKVEEPAAARKVDPPEVSWKECPPEVAWKECPPEVARKVDPSDVVHNVDPPEVPRNIDPPRTPTSVSEFHEQPSLGYSTSSELESQKSTRKRYEQPTEIEKNKILDRLDLNTKSKSPTIRMIVHDLAGQAIYYDTHYLFLKSHAPYILIHDLMKPLDETAVPRFKPSEKDEERDLKNPFRASNLDYMLSWLDVLDQLRKSEKQEESERKQERASESEKGEQTETRKEKVTESEKQDETERKKEIARENEKREETEKNEETARESESENESESESESESKVNQGVTDYDLPPVVIALTNKDRFTGDIEEVKGRIQKVITERKFTNVLPNFYVIDNTKASGKNDPIKELRDKIFKLCQEILDKESPMSLSLLKYETALSKVVFSKKRPRNYISVDEAKKIAEELSIESVEDALTFLHRQGIIVYYKQCPNVVLNPPWLMNLFTEVITVLDDADESYKARHRPFHKELRENGLLMQEYLKEHSHGDLLENLMQKVSLMCPLVHEGKQAYLVPSVAPFMEKGDSIVEKLTGSSIASIFIIFLRKFLPPGVFTRFQVNLVNKCRDILQVKQPKLFCNYTLLPLELDGVNFDVYLIQLIEKIKIGVVPKEENVSKQSLGKFAVHLKTLVKDCLEDIKSDEPLFYRGLQYHFGVKCTGCVNRKKKACYRHCKINCEHDECAHMRSLSEVEKCSNNYLWCTGDETETLKFDLEPVKYWICKDAETIKRSNTEDEYSIEKRKKERSNIEIREGTGPSTSRSSAKDLNETKKRSNPEAECSIDNLARENNETLEGRGPSISIASAKDAEAIKRSNPEDECSIDKRKKARPNTEIHQGTGPSTSRTSAKADNEAIKRSNPDGESNIDNPKKARPNKETHEESGSSTSIVSAEAGSSSVDTCSTHRESSSGGTSHEVLSTSEWKQRKIDDLNSEVYDKICDELNIENCGRDYKTLAGRMKYTVKEVKKFEKKKNPSDALLSHWGKKRGNTVIKLKDILKNMGNDAAAEILEKAEEDTI